MSKFFKALEQAERDRALKEQAQGPPVQPPAPAPASVFRAPEPIPPATAPPAEGVDDHLVSLVTPAAFEAEQYRALRHIVEQRHKSTAVSIVAVSSPAVGDGKTTTAINLAGALAQAPEARVLLIEADLRHPSMDKLLGFGDAAGGGLVDAILDPRLSLSQVVHPCPPSNLNVILAGQTPPSPYEILKSPRLGELLEEARREYDYVVVDTPPLVAVQDCRVIARWVDTFLVVVAAHRTPRRLVEEALTVVDPAKIMGLVFNGDDPLLSSYHPGHYAEYYSRGRQGSEVTRRWGRAIRKMGSSLGAGRGNASHGSPSREESE